MGTNAAVAGNKAHEQQRNKPSASDQFIISVMRAAPAGGST
jgi:hypothetical protein